MGDHAGRPGAALFLFLFIFLFTLPFPFRLNVLLCALSDVNVVCCDAPLQELKELLKISLISQEQGTRKLAPVFFPPKLHSI